MLSSEEDEVSTFLRQYTSTPILIPSNVDGYNIMHGAFREGPKAVASIMFNSERVDIQHWGCWTLGKLATKNENLEVFISTGCIAAIVRAMSMYFNSSTIVSQGLIALMKILEDMS